MNTRTNPIWTPDNLDIFRAMALDGKSGGEVAAHFGVSRNVIIGKAHRMGIQLMSQPQRRKSKHGGPPRVGACKLGNLIKKIKEGRLEPRLPQLAVSSSDGVHLFQLTPWQCHWPMWGDRERTNLHYCGAKIQYGAVYCHAHKSLMSARRVA